MQITDPRILPPNFYFVSKSGIDFISAIIQWWIGLWNHSMLSRTQGKIVEQAWQIVEKPIDVYMKKNIRMDFFTLKDINPSAIAAMNNYINKRMAGKWWTQTYDGIGIIGQIFKKPWIHTPGLDYCSVFELAVLRSATPWLPVKASNIIMAQKVESNPQELHDMYVNNPDVFNYEGAYESDEGIIVSSH